MSDFEKVCEKAVRLGADALMERFGRVTPRHKGYADLVTEADYASQDVIRRAVLEAFPDHRFLGEETMPDGADPPQGDSPYRWIVDPLDGTTNYVHTVPHFAVSLALEHAGEPVVGCIFNPISGECFTASRGNGAFLNGRPIRSSQVSKLEDALASAGFPARVAMEDPDVKIFLAGLGAMQAIRRTGSAALNMCYVACGRFDVAWSFCTKIWDVAAGALVIREAGGLITAPSGGEFEMATGRFLAAANPSLMAQLLDLATQAGI